MARTPSSYVYVLSDGRGPKKIGCSSDPWGRCRTLRYGADDYNLRVAVVYYCPGYARIVERETHRLLRDKRLGTEVEWFTVTIPEARFAIELCAIQVEVMLAAGMPVSQVAKRLKLGKSTLYKWRDAVRPVPVVDAPTEDDANGK